MDYKNLQVMETFDEKNLPGLQTTVLGALELFIKEGLPDTSKVPQYKKPVVMGSGNAEVTAKILFGQSDAIFANENNYKEAVEREGVDGALIFSASGEKHAIIAAQHFKSKKVPTTLVTCNPHSSAGKILGEEHCVVTSKNREPYTYNTSTYMGWLFAMTQEDPQRIYDFIEEKVKPILPKNIGEYSGYLLVTPEFFSTGNRLFEVKFIELFARRVARDVRTYEEMKHAITVVPYTEGELAIQFGEGEFDCPSGNVIKVPLPKNCGYAALMAIGYYVIGEIQEQKAQWFKENLKSYIQRLNKKDFGKGLKMIVE